MLFNQVQRDTSPELPSILFLFTELWQWFDIEMLCHVLLTILIAYAVFKECQAHRDVRHEWITVHVRHGWTITNVHGLNMAGILRSSTLWFWSDDALSSSSTALRQVACVTSQLPDSSLRHCLRCCRRAADTHIAVFVIEWFVWGQDRLLPSTTGSWWEGQSEVAFGNGHTVVDFVRVIVPASVTMFAHVDNKEYWIDDITVLLILLLL